MKKRISTSKTIFMLLIFMVTVLIGNENVFAATTVTDFNGLKNAIETGTDNEINVQETIEVTETLKVNRDVKITGGGVETSQLLASDGIENIFLVEDGKTLTLENITLDGNKQARLIYSNGGTLEITGSTLQNGCPGANAKVNPGGGIFLRGGSLTATNTDFIGNTPGTNTKLPKGDGDLNGGAIYSGSTKADIKITGGSFKNNEVKAYGHGAAIYQENGTLNINVDDEGKPLTKEIITSFKNNKGHVEGGNPGTQGACIHTRDKVKATISDVTAEIAKGFNTGGFLRSWKSDVTVTNSKFTIKDLGDGYGYSGGALCFEGGTSNVKGSTFTCTGSKLFHAGGFIDIVGTGTHFVDNNTMTGDGVQNYQFKAIASFGGAISVEEGASATVTIKDNTITDTSASDTGGAIAIGTHKGKSTPSTVNMSGNTITNPGTYYYGGQYGGGVFVAPGATVTMSKDTITNAKSSYGGGVYNEGNLTITGGSSLTGGVGSKLGGEIYNNGDLTVDDATITGSFVGGAAWQQYASHGKNFEFGGTNIYAEKSVTITPKANITTGKDVRVLDGQSKILLTGTLTKEIDVSVSEVAGGSETQNRKVGYVVAAGKDGYQATYSDANFLHYIGRTNKEDANHYSNQPRAEFSDHESLGAWDFVLNPQTKQVVLGQRVKLTLHANGKTETPAKFEDVSAGRDDKNGILTKLDTVDTKEDIYDIYASGPKSAILAPEPIRKGYEFTGWYEEQSVRDDKADKNQSGKTLVEDQKLIKGDGEITEIINPNEYELFAGWEKVIVVEKVWDDNNDKNSNRPESVTVKLFKGSAQVAGPIELNAENDWKGKFRNIRQSKFAKPYTVKEVPEQYIGYKKGVVSGDDINGFTITNSTEYTTVEGSKTWEHGENKGTLPTTVTVNLYEDGNATGKSQTGASWKFEKLPKYKNKQEVKYTLEEAPVDHYSSAKSADGYSFTNTFTNKYKVTYEFKPEDTSKTLPKAVTNQKPEDKGNLADGTKITPATFNEVTTEDGTWKFKEWQDKDNKVVTEQTINKADIHFIGIWKFIPKTYKVTYEFKPEDTSKTLPEAVTKLKPDNQTGVANGTTITPQTFTDVTDGEDTWTFKGWEPTEQTIEGADVKFVGTWTLADKTDPKPKTGNVYVKYIAEDGTVLEAESAVKTNAPVGETYTTEQKTFKGYEFLKMADGSALAKGTVAEGDLHVVYVYKKTEEQPQPKTGNVFVEYIAEDGTVLEAESAVKTNAPVGETYTTEQKIFKDYEFLKMADGSAAAKGKVIEGDLHVVYVYKVKDKPNPPTKITTDYVDEQGTKLIPSKDGAKPKEDIPGYEYLKTEKTKDKVTHIYKKIEKPTPQPPIIPEKPEFNPFWPIYFGSDEKHVVSEKTALNKEDHKAYMFGYPNWNFLPNSNMTRAEVTAMFARLLKNYPSTDVKYNLPYSDVFESDWYYPAVGFMTENNIIKGYEDGTFRPNAPITRAEFATIASKFEELVGNGVNGFKDVPATHWALKYINSAYARGWVTGYEDGTFRPDRYITRAEVVTVTNKMLIRYADVDFVRANKDIMLHFKDLDESHWAYFNIMEATHGHDFTRKANMLDEIWHRLNGEAFIFPDLKYNDR